MITGVVQYVYHYHDRNNDDLFIFMEFDEDDIRLEDYLKEHLDSAYDSEDSFKTIMKQVCKHYH